MRKKRGPYKVRRHPVLQPQDQSYRLIALTRGQNAIVDAEDFKWLSQWNWCASWMKSGFYALRREGRRIILLHCQILNFRFGKEVDHRNGNSLDNRRENLRHSTHSENARNRGKQRNNSSGFKGVYWYKRSHKWRAQIQLDGKMRYIGYFNNLVDAARAYDKKARELHGRFCHLNFPR